MHPIFDRTSLLRQDDRKQLIVLLQEVEEARIPLLQRRKQPICGEMPADVSARRDAVPPLEV